MLCDYLRVIRDAVVSKAICPQDLFSRFHGVSYATIHRVFLEKTFAGYESAHLSPSSASSKVALQPGGIQLVKYGCTTLLGCDGSQWLESGQDLREGKILPKCLGMPTAWGLVCMT